MYVYKYFIQYYNALYYQYMCTHRMKYIDSSSSCDMEIDTGIAATSDCCRTKYRVNTHNK